jgi:hypothetical protein
MDQTLSFIARLGGSSLRLWEFINDRILGLMHLVIQRIDTTSKIHL